MSNGCSLNKIILTLLQMLFFVVFLCINKNIIKYIVLFLVAKFKISPTHFDSAFNSANNEV